MLRPATRRALELLLLVLLALVFPRAAHADSSSGSGAIPVAVLALDSDDAEEQADALTGALRSRVRASNAWSLIETSQSFGMLAAALRCPTKPLTPDCKERMATQLKADRYIFGYVLKGPQPGQVTAEVHLYQPEKQDIVARESFSDNLKDSNDDALRAVGLALLQRLGADVMGKLVVHLGEDFGEVVVDGDKRVPLQKGVAEVELAPGTHSVESAEGKTQKRNVVIVAGTATTVDLAQPLPPPPAATAEWSFPTRKVLGGTLAVGSVVLFAFATINGLEWLDDQEKVDAFGRNVNNTNNADQKPAPGTDTSQLCETPNNKRIYQTVCRLEDDRVRHSTIFWATAIPGAILGAAGAYFLLTDGGSREGEKKKAKTRVVPTVGAGSAGVVLSGSF